LPATRALPYHSLVENIDQQPGLSRRAYFAGSFYPGDPVELSEQVKHLLADNRTKIDSEIVGLVAPHAGYMYSGGCAAAAFSALKGKRYDTVVVIAPSHQAFFHNVAVFRGGAYQTPLGVVYTDLELARKIANTHPKIVFANEGHFGGGRPEHSLEVQLPFLQMTLGDFKLVPLVMGSQEHDIIVALGEVLGAMLENRRALIVASTDLSHYHDADTAARLDQGISSAVEKFDWRLLYDKVASGQSEACGAGPVMSCIYAAKRLGAKQAQIIKYAHSGEVSGDNREVVGYLSAAFTK